MTRKAILAAAAAALATGCSRAPVPDSTVALPPGALSASPRHGEWTMVRTPQGDSLRAWLVYPERSTPAPVIVVIHENTGLIPWIQGVADQFAAAGFIAIAPDLLSSRLGATPTDVQAARAAISSLNADDVHRQIRAVADYAMALPAASPRYGIVGFCWGGGVAFQHAVRVPALAAAVVYYGPSPPVASLATIRAPVLGLYGGVDQRINATVPRTDSAMRAMRKTFRPITYDGAGHGFLRQLDGQEGANRAAANKAWPETIAWFRRYLGER